MIRELKSYQFTERLKPIFEHLEVEAAEPNRLNEAYFFPHWQKLMQMGIARTWEDDGCVLGALFCPDTFSGRLRGLVMFWFALPEARSTGRPIGLLDAFEAAAAAVGCEVIASAASEKTLPEKLKRIYQKRGYSLSETIFERKQ